MKASTLRTAIARELERAKKTEGEGMFPIETPDGMVAKVYYTTRRGRNVKTSIEMMTLEAYTWEKYGCRNNEEWRRHINRSFWEGYASGLKI